MQCWWLVAGGWWLVFVLTQAVTESLVWLELAGVYTGAKKFLDAAFCISKAGTQEDSPFFWNVLGKSLSAMKVAPCAPRVARCRS